MSNMSYCAFENTSKDAWDALDKIHDLFNGGQEDIMQMSEYEAKGLSDLLAAANEIANLQGEIEDILEIYNE